MKLPSLAAYFFSFLIFAGLGILLINMVAAQSFTRADYLTHVSTQVDLTYAESIYRACNPEEYKYLDGMNLQWSGDINILKSINKEIWRSYIAYRDLPVSALNETCRPRHANETKGTGDICWNDTIIIGYYSDPYISWRWEPWNGQINAKAAVSIQPKCELIKISSDLKPTLGPREIDHIPSIKTSGSWVAYPEYSWWNSSWTARQTLDVNTSTVQSQFQFHVYMPYDTDMGSVNMTDIRVTNNCTDEAFLVDAYNESQSGSGNITFWINMSHRVPTNATLCVYYGNAAALPVWNGNTTFEWFFEPDDYGTQALNGVAGWSGEGIAWYEIIADASESYKSRNVVQMFGTTNDADDKNIEVSIPQLTDASLVYRKRVQNSGWHKVNVSWVTPITTYTTCVGTTCDTNEFAAGSVNKILLKSAGDPDYNFQLRLMEDATPRHLLRFYDDDVEVHTGAAWSSILATTAFGADPDAFIDTMFLAKMVQNVGVIYKFGGEEKLAAPPNIAIQQPFNTTYANNTILYNITMDQTGGECWYNLGFNNITMTNSSGTWNAQNTTSADGTYQATFYCNSSGNDVGTANEIYTIDTTPPVITISLPQNVTHGNNTIEFNITANENLSAATVQLSGSIHMMTNASGQWQYYNDTLTSGTYEALFWVNDSVNNTNTTSVWFTIDLIAPILTISNPFNTSYSTADTEFNMTGNEVLSWAAVDLDGTNHTMTNTSGQWQYYNASGLLDGSHTAMIWANDSFGNLGTSTVSFTIDTVAPSVTINLPLNGSQHNSTTVELNWTVNESTNWIAYSLNGGANVSVVGRLFDDTEDSWTNESGTDLENETLSFDENFSTSSGIDCGAGGVKTVSLFENYTYSRDWGPIMMWNGNFSMQTGAGSGWVNLSTWNYNQNRWDLIAFGELFNGWLNGSIVKDDLGLSFTNPLQIQTRFKCNFQITRYYDGQLIYNGSRSMDNLNITAIGGLNNVTVYANDTAGNMNQSIYIFFEVNEGINITNPENTTYINQLVHSLEIENKTGNQLDTLLYSLNGAANVSFVSGVNVATAAGFNTFQVWANDSAGQNYTSNVSFTNSIQFLIDNPINQTYYNQYIHQLNITNGTVLDVLLYSLNGAANVSFADGDSIYFPMGVNLIEVWANNTVGTIFTANVTFTISIECINTTMIGTTICGGPDFFSVVTCRQFGPETFQFDPYNMTFCEYGCFDGGCIGLDTSRSCKDRCLENESMCLHGSTIQCELSSNGCFEWNDSASEYCEFGCFRGLCENATDTCSLGESRCDDDGKTVQFCDDDNNDGFLAWSNANITNCEYRCEETYNESSQLWNASCHYHSYTTPEAIADRLAWLGTMMAAPFQSEGLKVAAIFVLAVIAAIVGSLFGGWKAGSALFFIVLLFGTIAGWVPWYFAFITFVIGGILIFKSGGDD